MDKFDSELFAEERRSVSVREWLAGYISHWPLFMVCMFLCVGGGIVYSRYTVPRYMAVTSFVIKGAEGGKLNSNDLIETALNGKTELNLNNDMLLITSAGLMERTVAKNNFNISYFIKGRIHNVDVYKEAPFNLSAKQLTDSNNTYTLNISGFDTTGGSFLYGPEKAEKTYTFRWNEPFVISGQSFVLVPKSAIKAGNGGYIVQWKPVATAAADLAKGFTVKPLDTKTSVVQLSLKTENLQKGKDVLNALFLQFNLADKEDRNKLSEGTVQFIEDRLVAISVELKHVEGNLEEYQGNNRLVDVKGQSAQSLENSSVASKTVKDLAIQQRVVDMTLDYFINPANSGKLVPSAIGLNDGTLSTLITQYNDLQLKKERETPLVALNSTVMQDLNTRIGTLKGSILESLASINKGLRLQENNFRQQNYQSQSFLAALPHNERVLQEIKRKQSITEGLYLYLLQKREEAAISGTAATVANYRQIDLAKGYGPVEPNTKKIIISTALLGIFLAFGIVYLRNLLNDKIASKEDIIRHTTIPLLGQITHIPKRKKTAIPVLERNITGEEFRAIRTNLSFLAEDKDKKVIMVTSSVTGEGKSFISLNLAAVCAMPGKKVALLEFDMRQPVIASRLGLNAKGLTDYLTGDVTALSDMYHVLEEIPALHLYPCGPIPMNPADLLLKDSMNRLFELLRAEYDYILIDSPPAGLVSDPFILGKHSDIVLYIIRNQKTLQKHIASINEIVGNDYLKNISLILNDVKKAGNYGYGYGSNYNYGNSSGVKKKFSFA